VKKTRGRKRKQVNEEEDNDDDGNVTEENQEHDGTDADCGVPVHVYDIF